MSTRLPTLFVVQNGKIFFWRFGMTFQRIVPSRNGREALVEDRRVQSLSKDPFHLRATRVDASLGPMPSMLEKGRMTAIRGQCLCGEIRYEVDGAIGPMGHCHCATCRKAHAAAFSTTARVARKNFMWTGGEELLRAFESSPGKKRFFCPNCGSHLIAAWDHEDEVILRVGSLIDDPGSKPVIHIWTEQKAAWFDLAADLPALARGIPRRTD